MTTATAAPTVRRRTLTPALCGAAAVLACGMIAVGLAAGAAPDERWQLAARYTARLAFLLFMPVYVASAWNRLAPSAGSRWVMKRRRSLGLAFATTHTIHLGALTTYNVVAGTVPDPATLIVGGGAFATLYAMVLTSNDAAVRRLGGRRWQSLHRFGMHYLWFVFAFSYAGRVLGGKLEFAPLLALALAGLGLRITARAVSQGRPNGRVPSIRHASTGAQDGSSAR